jgi:hypothetical protein
MVMATIDLSSELIDSGVALSAAEKMGDNHFYSHVLGFINRQHC